MRSYEKDNRTEQIERRATEIAKALTTPSPDVKPEANGQQKMRELSITPPNFEVAAIEIVGISPYVQNRFSVKAGAQMRANMEAGSRAKKGSKRAPKDFKGCYEEAKHTFPDGTCGLPAPAFRNAMVSACRLVGFAMTRAKCSIFIEADGVGSDGTTPLVKFTKGEPGYSEMFVRNTSGVPDIRPRPCWQPGWRAVVRIRFDADQFSAGDVMNLLARAGMQVGIGEGRPDSKDSCGMGWGLFQPVAKDDSSDKESNKEGATA